MNRNFYLLIVRALEFVGSFLYDIALWQKRSKECADCHSCNLEGDWKDAKFHFEKGASVVIIFKIKFCHAQPSQNKSAWTRKCFRRYQTVHFFPFYFACYLSIDEDPTRDVPHGMSFIFLFVDIFQMFWHACTLV